MSAALSLKPSYYEALKRLTLELAGIKLGTNHEFLVETRLTGLARREGFDDLRQMIDELFSRGQTRLAVNVVSALIEREMRFFDDKVGFAALEDSILPRLIAAYKGGTIKILCYGCGSGQDAISAAIMMGRLKAQLPGLKFHITGVDYPSHALTRAQDGRFTHFEVQRGLPARDLVTHFHRQNEDWIVNDSVKEMVEFKAFHLLSNPSALGQFQLVMFRNSLHRYSPPAQMRILRSMAPLIVPHGYLMLGSSETLNDLNFGFDEVSDAPGMFKRHELKVEPEPEIDDGRKKPTGRKTFEKRKKRDLSIADMLDDQTQKAG